jgi:tRNA pseudouridine38-40 synthase
VEAASRTDRGVHAHGQVVCFSIGKSIEPPQLRHSLNAVLPPEIRVKEAEIVSGSFHPTLDARAKEYHYFISLGAVQPPMDRLYSWHIPRPLDLDKMAQASRHFLGRHDFSAFANEPENDPVCTIERLVVAPIENKLRIEIRADRFLYKMARNIAGTLAYIGQNKLAEDSVPAILASRNRARAGMAAPARGLFLMEVFYS